jgi:hypothetical protein
MNALHYSQFNTVNVPLTFCKVYEAMGHSARLLTLYKHRGDIEEDICLNKRPFDPWWLRLIRRKREEDARRQIARAAEEGAVWEFKPAGPLSELFFKLRDELRAVEFKRLTHAYGLDDFDIYHFHGGVDFFRDSRWIRRLSALGKPIVCHYHGPDLRTRGVVKAVDGLSSLNLTSEFDLLRLHPNLRYLPIPYDCSPLPEAAGAVGKIRIIHAPSNPAAKGTHLIEPVLKEIVRERPVEYVVLTGVSRLRVIEEKTRSHIAIEQIGNFGGTGYGVNSLETLAMNIPTLTEFTLEYERFLTGHPFILVDKNTLHDELVRLIDNEEYRLSCGRRGRQWVVQNHSFAAVWQAMLGYMDKAIPETARRLRG